VENTGLGSIADQVRTLFLVGGMFALMQALGIGAMRALGAPASEAPIRLAWATALGAGLMAMALLASCTIFGVNKPSLFLTVAILAVASFREVGAAMRCIRAALLAIVDSHSKAWERGVAVAVLTGVGLIVVGFALTPTVDWDSLAYHLDVPAEWISVGAIHAPVDNYHVAYVGLVHMLYLPLLAAGSASGPALLSTLFMLTTIIGTFGLGSAAFSERVGKIGLWLVVGYPFLILVGLTPRVDITLTLFLVGFHAAVYRLSRGPDRGMIAIAVLLLGMSAGIKYLALPYAFGVLVFLVIASGAELRFSTRLAVAAVIAAGGATVALPWFLKNWLLLGSPFYPFFSPPVVAQWFTELRLALPIGHEYDASVFDVLRDIRPDFNWVDFVLRPATLVPDPDGKWAAPNLLLTVAPLAMLGRARGSALAIGGPAALYLVIALAVSERTNLRYLLPAVPAIAIVSAYVLAPLGCRGRPIRAVTIAAIMICGLPTAMSLLNRGRSTATAAFLSGHVSRYQYLDNYWETRAHVRTVRWIHENLPEDARILMLFEARGYLLERAHVQDLTAHNWALLAPAVRDGPCPQVPGITHLWVNDDIIEYFRSRGMNFETLRWPEFEAYSRKCLTLIRNEFGARIYSVRATQS
jgi:hypothetical protein